MTDLHFKNVAYFAAALGIAVLCWTANATAAAYTMTTSDILGDSSFNTAGHWSSGLAPSAGNTYTANYLIRTPGTNGTYTFAGDSLTITNSGTVGSSNMLAVKITSGEIIVNNLILDDGFIANTCINQNAIWTLGGSITLASGGGYLNVFSAGTSGTGYTYSIIAANITGSGDLTIANSQNSGTPGNGYVSLTGSNTYTGNTYIRAGATLVGAANGAFGSGSVSVATNGQLELTGGIAVANAIRIAGGVSSGDFVNISGNNTASGLISLAGGSAVTIVSNSGTLQLSNTGTITTVSGTSALTLGGAGNISVASVLGSGISSLTKTGAGSVTLSGVSTYTGKTTISAGTLFVTSTGSLATSGIYIASAGSAASSFDGTQATYAKAIAASSAFNIKTAISSDFGTSGTVSGTNGSSDAALAVSWRTQSSAETAALISDVINVTGGSATGGFTLTLSYSNNASGLSLAYWDGSAWQKLANSVVDATSQTVTAAVSSSIASSYTQFAVVPEPASAAMLTLAGLGGLLAYAWRKRRISE